MEQQFSLAFVLYKDQNIVPSEISRFYQKLWQEPLSMTVSLQQITGQIGMFDYVISFVDEPIDAAEMTKIAEHNSFYEEGLMVATHHQCHAIVGVKGNGSAVARYQILTKLLAAVVSPYNAKAVYLGEQSLYYSRTFLLEQAKYLQQQLLPVQAWIYFGFYAHASAYWVYTQGMSIFGRQELEISSDHHTMKTMHDILIAFCAILMSSHRQFEEGELVEIGDYFVTIHYRNSPTLRQQTLLLSIENE